MAKGKTWLSTCVLTSVLQCSSWIYGDKWCFASLQGECSRGVLNGRRMTEHVCWCGLEEEGCSGLRAERMVFVDANGNKQESRGGGRVCSMRWNSVMQRISRLQRSDGQFSCSNTTDLEPWKGTRRIHRATTPWTCSRARASRSRRAPCQTGHAYSSFGQRKY